MSFAKNIGKRLFNNEAEAADKITSYIKEDNPGVDNLQVTVENGVATINGEAKKNNNAATLKSYFDDRECQGVGLYAYF